MFTINKGILKIIIYIKKTLKNKKNIIKKNLLIKKQFKNKI